MVSRHDEWWYRLVICELLKTLLGVPLLCIRLIEQ